ncbi:unnamed protein product, partial [Closterium sp. NIES-54]
ASEFGSLPGTAPAEALHTFMLDSGASHCFFRDSTTLTPLPAPIPVRLADPPGDQSWLVPPLSSRVRLSLPPLPPTPAPPCLPYVNGRQRAAPHSSFPPTTAPLQTLAPCLLARDLVHTALDGGGWRCVDVPGLGISCLCSRYVSGQALPYVFLGFVPDAPCSQFYHPTSRRVFPSQVVMFDESVPFYRLFPYRSAPPPPSPLFLAPGPPLVAVDSGAASGGAASRGAEPGGAEYKGAETGGSEPGGVATGGGKPGGAEPEGVELGGAVSEGAESGGAEPQGAASSGAFGAGGAGLAGAGGPGVAAGVGVTGGTATTGPGGARTRGTRAAGTGGVEGTGAGHLTESSTTGAGGAGAGGAEVGGPGVGGSIGGGAGAVDPGGTPASPLPAPSPYTEQSGGLTERRAPVSRPVLPVCTDRRVPRSRPPLVPGTHAMTLRPSFVPLRVPVPAPPASSLPEVPDPESDRTRAASPTVSHLLAIVVTDPSFESAAASAPLAELLDFAAAYRLDYATALVAESASASPPFVKGECALGTDVLEDKQKEFECLAAAVPRFASMLLAPEGDPYAPDIPTPRSYAEAITGPYSSQWQAAMDAEMASWKSTV